MIERTLARRYAAALLRVTDAEGSTEETEGLLQALKEAVRSDPSWRALLAHPRIPRAAKKRILRGAFEGRARPSFLDFLDLLVDRNRTEILADVADLYDRLADASHGVVRVQVLSWRPLSEGHRSELVAQLGVLTGRKVALQEEVDPSLRGGLLARIGDTLVDGTLAHRLKELGERLREPRRE